MLRDDRAILKDEMTMLNDLLGMNVRRDKKLDELLGLMDRIEQESPRETEEKVLDLHGVPRNASGTWSENWRTNMARVPSW